MSTVGLPAKLGKTIRQKRGQKTYDALVRTGFKLLRKQEFDEITVAELAKSAGYSVGAFYARFRSKDEFFEALVAFHVHERREVRRRFFAELDLQEVVVTLVDDLVTYYWDKRRFWRAALMRSMRDPDFWEPVRKLSHEVADGLIAKIERETGRKPTATEETNLRFAYQMALGLINNTIINRPGPIFMDQKEFIDSLTRAFRLVADYDRLADLNR
jgi:AcrR family transcriptional regulator